MSLTNGATLLASSTFQGQVSVALLVLANTIRRGDRLEAWADTTQDAKRAQVASAIYYRQGTVPKINETACRYLIGENSVIRDATSPTDNDVQYVCGVMLGDTSALDSLLNL